MVQGYNISQFSQRQSLFFCFLVLRRVFNKRRGVEMSFVCHLKNTISLAFRNGKSTLILSRSVSATWAFCLSLDRLCDQPDALCSAFTKVFDSLNKIANPMLRKIQRSHCGPDREKGSPGGPGKRPRKEKGGDGTKPVAAEVPLSPQLAPPYLQFSAQTSPPQRDSHPPITHYR